MNTILLPLLFLALPALGPLVAPTPTVDKGEIKTGLPLLHEFEMTHSDERGIVAITAVSTACGCSKWEVAPKVLKPGEIAKLSVVITTLTQAEGPAIWKSTVKYTLTPDTGEASTHEIELAVTAKIIREITVEPPLISVSSSGDTTRAHTITMTDRRGSSALAISKAVCTEPKIKLDIRPGKVIGTNTVQDVAVTIPGDLPTGSHDDVITLTTNDPACPELKIPLKIAKRAAGDVSVSPESPTVRFTKGQAEASTLVQLRAGGKPVSIAKVDCKQDGVTLKFSEGSGIVATVRVVVNLAKAGSSGQADVTLQLAEPAGTVIIVPVSWYVP